MRRLCLSLITLALIAMFAVVTGNTASAQASCPDYTVKVDPALGLCLPISIRTFWADPLVHNASITTTGTTIVPAPAPPGLFVAPLRAVFVDGAQVFPVLTPTPPVIQLACGLCAQVTVSKDPLTGCVIITIVAHPGPC